jgi:hypothetical protein
MANNNIEQVMKALAGHIPEDAQKTVEEAFNKFLENAVSELDKEYNEKLEEAYKKITEEKKTDEATAEQGYAQAWEIITDLRDRLEIQKEEFEQALNDGYEEAYQMLQEERSKNETLEVGLYEEYDKRMSDVKEYMVDKIDQFLALQGNKYYEMAKKDVLNDPAIAEHKLAFEKVLEVAQNFLTDEDFAFATSSRVEGLNKQLTEQKRNIQILEAKNMNLATQLNESIKKIQSSQSRLDESKNNERTARAEKARTVEGRGEQHQNRKDQKQVVIGEQKDVSSAPVTEQKVDDRSQRFVEQQSEDIFADWKYLTSYNNSSSEPEKASK